ncbi:MAG: NADH-quinone oxidoreductase subunit L [Holophagae bacterium]|nr:MAG: NADH-quinone oxidoreductase subunit L [Holophagae bacterium]
MLGNLWLIPILCLAGAAANLALGMLRANKRLVSIVGVGSVGLATVTTFIALSEYLGQARDVIRETYFTWIAAGEFVVDASFQLDQLSAIMISFVTFVGFLIHVYSIGYMHGETDRGYARYFAYLNLFMFSMLVLVLGSNLPVLFIGWEGVGLCSYLLIGYYYEQEYCATAGKKAFIVNRIGDFGFLLAIFAAFAAFGTSEFLGLREAVAVDPGGVRAAATVIGLLLFVGAIGKSAQLPLYVWLPDAMAGPTPVSALIHAATMVTAGVYMVARTNFFYQASPAAMLTVAVVGGLTAVFAATIGLAQNDIKKVLAYSTVSQLGYMFLGAGVGAFIAAIFHVVTHAFFKACLFLGSGSVIHACGGEQDMRKMGGLRKHMPITYWTFVVATLAIAGIPLFAGFVSKDEILAKVFAAGAVDLNHFGSLYTLLWVLAVAGAFMTAFYMFRAVYMTFHGEFRGGHEAEHHLHESPPSMTLPLIILGALSVVGGILIGFPGQLFHRPELNRIEHFLHPVMAPLAAAHGEVANAGQAAHGVSLPTEWVLVITSVLVAVAGWMVARNFYVGDQAFAPARRLAERFPFVHKLLLNKYWVDELYDAVVVRPFFGLARFSWKVVDVVIIDTVFVNGSAFAVELTGDFLRFLQTGNVRNYALSVALGILVLAVVLW